MDQGVIRKVKNKCRTVLLRRTIEALWEILDDKEDGMIARVIYQFCSCISDGRAAQIYDAIQIMNEAWTEIREKLIEKCLIKITCLDADPRS